MIYGTSNVHQVRDVTDIIGIRTLILRKFWPATSESPSISDLEAMKPPIPAVPGGLSLMGEQVMKEKGRYASLWTFQGVNGDGRSVTFKTRGNSIDYGFDPGFSQVPIQMHRDFVKMKDRFGGYPSNDGTTVIWPPELTETGGSSPLNTGPQQPAQTNPVYGIQAYFEMDGVYRYRYAEKTLPRDLQNGVGFIANKPPGEPGELTEGRNWLKAPTAFQRKGFIFDITEYYWLSRRGGWPEPVYLKGYFK